MEETIVIPSPNWFQVSILGASNDGWLVYGGPSKSLCFLEPLLSENIGTIDSNQRFRAHVFNRAHKEKIVSVDISPEWPEKRNVITGGSEGVVKEWTIESKETNWTIKYIHCHEVHSLDKEELAGVCYGSQTHAISVGSSGNICKWDLNTNAVKSYYSLVRNFKPTCISCSPHKPFQVAIGTRQGVIFLIDISGVGKLIYKVRGQDDEINRVSWCPQYRVVVKKIIEKGKKKEPFSAASRMERIRNGQEPSDLSKVENISSLEKNPKETEEEEVIIPEDDMFDVYKDYEANEFGHKKFEPEDIVVKVKEECKHDFLAECAKLKEDILKKKNEPEESIESLVEALDKAHVDEKPECSKELVVDPVIQGQISTPAQESTQDHDVESSEQKHLLASIGKYGAVRIWNKSGKLVASCTMALNQKKDHKDHKNRGPNWPTLHWFKPDSLLISDGKNQLLDANPLIIDSRSKFECRSVHSLHRRGLFCVTSNAPRVQTPTILADPASNWVVWTVGQDRNVISYDMKENKKIEVHTSCGGFIYEVKPCPYDAGKIAMGAGDGSVRVWETHTTNELEDQLATGVISSYWQNVQGKVLTVAWHPTKENLLAFSTAESRVGLLDVSGKCEKPAKNLPPALSQGVYSLSWGENMALYACGGGHLAMFRANKFDDQPEMIKVEVEGQVWDISSALYSTHGVVVGATNGGLALLDKDDKHLLTATFVFLKMIHNIAWHPQQISSSSEESKYKNYIAVTSVDKVNSVAILEYEDKDGTKQFKKLTPLTGHEGSVLQVAWNPHRDAQLLSTSQDATVRIWNVIEGECIAIFGGHTMSSLGAMWCPQPHLADKVISGGGDCCLRLWDYKDYPVECFEGVTKEPSKKKKSSVRAKERKERAKERKETEAAAKEKTEAENETEDPENIHEVREPLENVATTLEVKLKGSKAFLLPIISKQVNSDAISTVRSVLSNFVHENNRIDVNDVIKTCVPKEKGLDFLKIFGTMNDLNEVLDMESEHHLLLKDWDSYLMLLFYRGRVDDMIQFASANDLLDPYLLSLSPTVSFKYWKDTTQLYLAQLDRMSARRAYEERNAHKNYGGVIFRKSTAYLSIHNLMGAVQVLMDGGLHKDAYIMCRLRHMDSVANDILQKWAVELLASGSLMMAALCHLVRGDISEASIVLGRSNQVEFLQLAADLAKLAGHNAFAEYIETTVKTKESEIVNEAESELQELPNRVELIINEHRDGAGDALYLNEKPCKENELAANEFSEICNGNLITENFNGNSIVEDKPCNVNITAVNQNGTADQTCNGNVKAVNGKGFEDSSVHSVEVTKTLEE